MVHSRIRFSATTTTTAGSYQNLRGVCENQQHSVTELGGPRHCDTSQMQQQQQQHHHHHHHQQLQWSCLAKTRLSHFHEGVGPANWLVKSNDISTTVACVEK
ncbi:protein naked cuticle homolog [Drosophila elegans]|uniref:protein naked cuticle homolog n=1 Tax=Drosophila elegans TaxID=30023 RepID=UPI0007E5CD76|nr:protein naked cuticle homolog [Drosophila elegans]